MKNGLKAGWDSALGAAEVKTIVAVVFAVGGLSWAAYSMLSGGEKAEDNGPRVIASALDNEGNEVETDYIKASSDRQIQTVSSEIEVLVREQAQSALKAIDVPKGMPDGLSMAVVNAFIPILTGDHDSFVDAIKAMGGKLAGDLEEENPLFKNLAKVFKHAKVDLSRITVAKYEPPNMQDGSMGMRRQEIESDGEGEDNGPNIQTSVMMMRPASLFPDAPGRKDPSAVEVRIPVKPQGEDNESIFALVLTWNAEEKLWQPAAYQVITNLLMEDD